MIPPSVLQKLIPCVIALVVFGCDDDTTPSTGVTEVADASEVQAMDAMMSDIDPLETDISQAQTDARLADVGVEMSDATVSTTDSTTDASIDMRTSDAQPSVPPGPCPGDSDQTCAQLCATLTTCFADSTCLGLPEGDQAALLDACQSSCGFNSSTRDILCGADGASCEVVLERLFMADETLGTLCSGDFTPSDRQACADICARTNECAAGGDALIETEQSCRFQCLLQGAASVSECISGLPCDASFEAQVQACLQGRESQPPLTTRCEALCADLQNCEMPAFMGISASTTPESCVVDCEVVLTTPASIACAGRQNCGLTPEASQNCADSNLDAPSCEISCLRILECSSDTNPFGASTTQLQQCLSSCESGSTLGERLCSFETECNSDFLENFANCVDMSVQ